MDRANAAGLPSRPKSSPASKDPSPRRLQVLIVEDSASARQALARIVAQDPALEVMGAAADPYAAARQMRRQAPDVILLDLQLPRMDGLTFLRKLMDQRPLPVVVCSSFTEQGSRLMLDALEAGAVEVIAKPKLAGNAWLEEAATRICDAVRAAGQARLRGRARAKEPPQPMSQPPGPEPRLTADVILAPLSAAREADLRARLPRTEPVVFVGASTGGTEALRDLLLPLPADGPALAIVQHMPEGFTAAFARRLDSLCAIAVREARDGDRLRRGLALIAPGDRHMTLRRSGESYHAVISEGPLVARHRPSVDVLFRAAAQVAGPNAIGVILTGMGDDGARGMAEMRRMGAETFAQDEASCIVYGMPKEAVAMGGVSAVASLSDLPRRILAAARRPGQKVSAP